MSASPSKEEIHINSCNKSELLKLPYIGEKTASWIIEAREEQAFDSVEDFIDRVKGIGQIKAEEILNQFDIIFEYDDDDNDDNALPDVPQHIVSNIESAKYDAKELIEEPDDTNTDHDDVSPFIIKFLFTNAEDHKQCMDIYTALTNSTLSIAICKEIAEYATGKLIKCLFCEHYFSCLKSDKVGIDIFRLFRSGYYCKRCHDVGNKCKQCDTIIKYNDPNLYYDDYDDYDDYDESSKSNSLCSVCKRRLICPNTKCKEHKKHKCMCGRLVCRDCFKYCTGGYCDSPDVPICEKCGVSIGGELVCEECSLECDRCDCVLARRDIGECNRCGRNICDECEMRGDARNFCRAVCKDCSRNSDFDF